MSSDKRKSHSVIVPTPVGPCPECAFVAEERLEFYCIHHRCGGLWCQSAGLRSWVLYQPITAMEFEIMRNAMKTISVANGGEAGAAESGSSAEKGKTADSSIKIHD